jgi:uncharacterized protein (DUF1697 family)
MARVWIALLRAVNLGSRNKVPMANLRDVFEAAGCASVRTYIQSGNVVFEHEAPDARGLEAAVAEAFGVKSTIVLRTARQLRALTGKHPFGADTSSSHVAFLAAKPTAAALRALSELDAGPDRFERVGPDIALSYPNGVQGSRLTAARVEKALGVPATVRTWRTVEKLAELAAGS